MKKFTIKVKNLVKKNQPPTKSKINKFTLQKASQKSTIGELKMMAQR